MEALLQYLIKSAAVLTLFFICFKTLLSNETFFTTKRVYLLVGVLSCLLLPFVVITNYVTIDPIPLDWNNLPLVSQTPHTTNLTTWDWKTTLFQTYCIGVLIMVIRLLYQGYSVGRLIHSESNIEKQVLLTCKWIKRFYLFRFSIISFTIHVCTPRLISTPS